MEPKRTLHSGNLVRGVHAGDRKLFMIHKDIWNQELVLLEKIDGRKKNELGRLGDFRSKISYKRRSSFFIDFTREQYLVRWDDMREALKIVQRQKELQRQDKCGNS